MCNTEAFPLPLMGVFREKGRRFRLSSEFVFRDGKVSVSIPAGFDTDFNSVPRGFWNTFPPWEYPEAGVVHDFLYVQNGVSRREADRVHSRILELKGCPWWKRVVAYAALRAFGWAPWRRYRAQDAARISALLELRLKAKKKAGKTVL